MPKSIQPFQIEKHIYFIRGHKVMLDSDLARIYGVTTKRLNQQVHRNIERFPAEFMFQLTGNESAYLRLQNATSKAGRGGRRFRPYAFTEYGAVMISAVLKTSMAVQASIQIAKAFVQFQQLLSTHQELAQKLLELEKKYDTQFKVVFDAIRQLMQTPKERLPPPSRIRGFQIDSRQQ